ncbi:MAG: ATP-grasp domain-containing protein, partial [Gammaproteobacteria bacterium]
MYCFVCEFITGGGMQHTPLPPRLAREGDMMLSSLLDDLLAAGMQHLLITRDPRLPVRNEQVKTLPAEDDVWDLWRRCMEESAMVWIIAPETDGVLYELTRMAHASGCQVIGCTPDTIQLAASKSNTIHYLESRHIPCISVIDNAEAVSTSPDGWVVKPDDGVGGEGCRHFTAHKEMMAYLKSQRKKMAVQEFVPSIAASMSLLCLEGQAQLLASNRQLFHFNAGRGHLQGVVVNGLMQHAAEFDELAKKIAACMPGLQGYVGIDMVIGKSGPQVVEINPRLTTAYT